MPCWDPGYYYENSHTDRTESKNSKKQVDSLKKELASLGKKYNELKGRADKLTQFLCYACGTLVDRNIMPDLDERLIKWWNEHDEWDFNRTLETMKKKFGDVLTRKETIRDWFIHQAEDVHPLSNYHRGEYFREVYDAFLDWQKNIQNRESKIAELEKELAKLKAQR